MPPSSLSENPKRLPFCFARLPNLAISSGLLPCLCLDLAIPSQPFEQFLLLSDSLLGKLFD